MSSPETREVSISTDPSSGGPKWRAEHRDGRYLFYGPHSSYLFYSCGRETWDGAIMEARKRWNDMDPVRRNRWWGPDGRYAKIERGAG